MRMSTLELQLGVKKVLQSPFKVLWHIFKECLLEVFFVFTKKTLATFSRCLDFFFFLHITWCYHYKFLNFLDCCHLAVSKTFYIMDTYEMVLVKKYIPQSEKYNKNHLSWLFHMLQIRFLKTNLREHVKR